MRLLLLLALLTSCTKHERERKCIEGFMYHRWTGDEAWVMDLDSPGWDAPYQPTPCVVEEKDAER